MNNPSTAPIGSWCADSGPPSAGDAAVRQALEQVAEPGFAVATRHGLAIGLGGTARIGESANGHESYPIHAVVPSCPLERLGDRSFCGDYGIDYPYVAGGMARGIASVELVEALARARMLAFFGAAGLSVEQVRIAVDRLSRSLPDVPYGFNLIHSPNEPLLEAAIVDLYLKRGIRLAEASAYLDLTLPVVRYRVHGIGRGPDGEIVTPNRLIAKVSRVEVASKFFAPPPERFLNELVAAGELTAEQAALAREIPMAQDLTAEADSGGHTDNRPALTLLPTLLALRDRMQATYEFKQRLRVGAAGGIATPASTVAAFAMGAAYVLTGTVNQACIESGTSPAVRQMLAEAQQADVAMAPAADMFEMGVKVQVLKRGTMFSMRATRLYELYRAHHRLEDLPAAERANLEKNFFRAALEEIWESTRQFFLTRDPAQVERAERDPKHKMALVFRWYLGQSSRWANGGEPTRKVDYQVWCGPAMGAFNEWTKGTFLEPPDNRQAATVAMNLLYGAAYLSRVQALRTQGVDVTPALFRVAPKQHDEIQACLQHPRVAV